MVTGVSTPLGAAIVEALLADPQSELVLAVGSEREPSPVHDPRAIYRVCDLTRPRALHDLLWGDAHEHRIDRVIHGIQHRCAADGGPRVRAQNVDATRELVLACLDHPTITRLVYRSFGEIYAADHATSSVVDETTPLDFDPAAPQWVRDRVEADLTVCSYFGRRLAIAVLRCAEIAAPETGSQLWDYLQSRVCLRPLGFDPMLNLLSLEDACAALVAGARGWATGVFNIPGWDTLPLSAAIARSRRADVPVPGPLMAPLYGLRRRIAGFDFRYDLNAMRFHFGGVMDGERARTALGFTPQTPVRWPTPWWSRLLDRLGDARAAA